MCFCVWSSPPRVRHTGASQHRRRVGGAWDAQQMSVWRLGLRAPSGGGAGGRRRHGGGHHAQGGGALAHPLSPRGRGFAAFGFFLCWRMHALALSRPRHSVCLRACDVCSRRCNSFLHLRSASQRGCGACIGAEQGRPQGNKPSHAQASRERGGQQASGVRWCAPAPPAAWTRCAPRPPAPASPAPPRCSGKAIRPQVNDDAPALLTSSPYAPSPHGAGPTCLSSAAVSAAAEPSDTVSPDGSAALRLRAS